MQARVQDHLRVLKIDTTDIEIMVRAYANLKGLQNACLRNGKLKTGANLRLFAHGFNQRRGLFDFVDVGDWKEGTDNKVRSRFQGE